MDSATQMRFATTIWSLQAAFARENIAETTRQVCKAVFPEAYATYDRAQYRRDMAGARFDTPENRDDAIGRMIRTDTGRAQLARLMANPMRDALTEERAARPFSYVQQLGSQVHVDGAAPPVLTSWERLLPPHNKTLKRI